MKIRSVVNLGKVLVLTFLLPLTARAEVIDHERATILSVLAVARGLNDIDDAHFNSNRNPEVAHANWLASHYVGINTLAELTDSRHWMVDHPVLRQALVRFHAQLERMLYNTPRNASLFALQYHFQRGLTRAIAEFGPAEKIFAEDPHIHDPDHYHRAVADDLRSLLQVLAADQSQIVIEDSKLKIVFPFNAYAIQSVETEDAKLVDPAEPPTPITFALKDSGFGPNAQSVANAIRAKQASLIHIVMMFGKIKPVLDVDEPQTHDPSLIKLLRAVAAVQRELILRETVKMTNESAALDRLNVLHTDLTMAIKRFTMGCPAGLSAP